MEINNWGVTIESDKFISKRADYCQIISILRDEFGYDKIEQALNYQQFYRDFKRKNSRIFLEAFNMLSYHWQMGRAREYLDSLALEVQYSLICYLTESHAANNHPLDIQIGWIDIA